MNIVWCYILVPFLAIVAIPFLRLKGKAIAVYAAICVNAFLTSSVAVQTLNGQMFDLDLPGSFISGSIHLQVDALSAWFMLIMNFVFLTGGFYGLFYMNAYRNKPKNLSLHGILFVLLHTSLLSLCVIQNSIAFLIAWEIMALSAFLTVIFEHEKSATIKAGINFLIQSHISIIFLMTGFIWVASQTGSYDFGAIHRFSSDHPGTLSLILYLLFFAGFAIKAGFVPFHTWLPHAHPAAPAHISGIMSAVLIKIGIFGMLRMLLLIHVDYTIIGSIILGLSLISGLYGVMLAILQANLKKLLAFSSIENIGIIGIGIGLGCIGLGINNPMLSALGFAGALLHTLNHALFKSLLFYTAGNVYQATHTLNIEHLGGLIKKMPQTAALFLVAAIAISGIPPFNGFISEFIIYSGFYYWMQGSLLGSLMVISFSVFALVLIGGLALLCFTKAFGVVFLGNPRQEFHHEVKEVPFLQLLPLYLIAFFILIIGVFPQFFLNILSQPVNLLAGIPQSSGFHFGEEILSIIHPVTISVWVFILIVIAFFALRKFVMRSRKVTLEPTWGCAYVAPTPKLQYTGKSFSRSLSKIFSFILIEDKKYTELKAGEIFPERRKQESRYHDFFEYRVINYLTHHLVYAIKYFKFIQNGRVQSYVWYGIAFMLAISVLTVINVLK